MRKKSDVDVNPKGRSLLSNVKIVSSEAIMRGLKDTKARAEIDNNYSEFFNFPIHYL